MDCNLFLLFFLGPHHIFMRAGPKLWHIKSCVPRPVSRYLLSNDFLSFQMPQTDHLIFYKYFSITRSLEQALPESDGCDFSVGCNMIETSFE